MSRPVLVLVDPNDGRRQRFADAFQRYFEMYCFSSCDLAISAAVTMNAKMVVAHMEQAHGTGLDLASELRRDLEGGRCMIVVHGTEPGASAATVSVRAVHGANLVLSHDIAPQQLLKAISRRIKGLDVEDDTEEVEIISASRPSARRLRLSRPRMPSREQVQSFFHNLDEYLQWHVVRDALVKPRTPLIDELPHPDFLSWRDALLARPSMSNLRKILAKPVTPLVRELPLHRPPTMDEILRAQVTPRNLRVLLGMERPLPRIQLAA